jgi:hypothetical protein
MRVVGQIWLSNLQQFADDPEEIRRVSHGQEIPDVVLPSDYQGELEVDIDDDSMNPLSKSEKRDMHDRWVQNITALQQTAMNQAALFKTIPDVPRYNMHEIFEDTTELYGKKDVNRYLLDSNVEIPQEQPVDNTKELLNFNYKDAPPDIKAQIEQMYGLDPSAMHDTDLVTQATQAGQAQAEAGNDTQIMQPMTGEQNVEQPTAGAGSQ